MLPVHQTMLKCERRDSWSRRPKHIQPGQRSACLSRILSAPSARFQSKRSHAMRVKEKAKRNFKQRTLGIWMQMRRRCTDQASSSYPRYGGRGITICDEWQSLNAFRAWALTSGYAEDLTLDRIDNDGNYEPSNCRWATPKEQSNNMCTNVLITAFGETKTRQQWVRDCRCVVSYSALKDRMKVSGWDAETAITTPMGTWIGKSARSHRIADIARVVAREEIKKGGASC